MAVTVVIGSQWGDEGKGKLVDFLAESSDYVVRFNGGNNAGHTVINKFGKFPLHLLPSGIFSLRAKACITNGVVLDLDVLTAEIDNLIEAGFVLTDKLFISPRCHLILPYHKLLDRLYEETKGKTKTGTTGRGIGPVYADKVSYNGIRLTDLVSKQQFSEKLATQLAIKNKIIKALGEKALNQKEIEQSFFKLREKVLPFVKEPFPLLQKALHDNKKILLEGAQAVFLDNDWGTYPFVTASTIMSGAVTASAGIPPQTIRKVMGVVKAYTTRVGAGPFPTELLDETGEKLRKIGDEFGTTTGRPRRCGWLDTEMIRFAAQINGFTDIALTKLDVLDTFEQLTICTGYELEGKAVRYFEGDEVFLTKIKPLYKNLPGWMQSTQDIRYFEKLPAQAKQYIQEIEQLTGVRISYISTGPRRESMISR